MNSLVCLASAVTGLFRPAEARVPHHRLRAPAQPKATTSSATSTRRRGRPHVSRDKLLSLRNQDALRHMPFPLVTIARLEHQEVECDGQQHQGELQEPQQQQQRRALSNKQCQGLRTEGSWCRQGHRGGDPPVTDTNTNKTTMTTATSVTDRGLARRGKKYRTEVEKLRVQNAFFVANDERDATESNCEDTKKLRKRSTTVNKLRHDRSKRRRLNTSDGEDLSLPSKSKCEDLMKERLEVTSKGTFNSAVKASPLKVKITRSPVGQLETFVLKESVAANSSSEAKTLKTTNKNKKLISASSNESRTVTDKEVEGDPSKFKLKFLRDKKGRIVKVTPTKQDSLLRSKDLNNFNFDDNQNHSYLKVDKNFEKRYSKPSIRNKATLNINHLKVSLNSGREECPLSSFRTKYGLFRNGYSITEEKQEEESSSWLSTSSAYFVWQNEAEFKSERDEAANILRQRSVEVPQWRLKQIPTQFSDNDRNHEDSNDDDWYERVHSKLELDERRRKRWDIQRIRELHRLQRLRARYNKSECKESSVKKNVLYPDPSLITHIEVKRQLPVSVFACQLPKMEIIEFELPKNL